MRMLTLCLVAVATFLPSASQAEMVGAPKPWQLNLPEAASEIAARVNDFHQVLLYLTVAITIFVLGLLLYVVVRFRAAANPVAKQFSHNTLLEVVWTAIPVLILLSLVIPTLRLLYMQEKPPPADIVIKATGNQWYWSYEYPDDEFSFDALMLSREEVSAAGLPDSLWKLATDQAVVVPIDKNVLVQVTSSDVIHAWAMPAMGSKVDAVPGRIHQTWFRATKTGTFYGQCSELCGQNHAYMPITLRVVSEAEYAQWLEQARAEFASAPARQDVALTAQR